MVIVHVYSYRICCVLFYTKCEHLILYYLDFSRFLENLFLLIINLYLYMQLRDFKRKLFAVPLLKRSTIQQF